MANVSDFLELKLLDHSLGVSSYTMPSTVYLALFSSNPTDTISAGAELSGDGYARIPITFGAASNGSIANSGTEDFPEAEATWTFSYWVIFDADTSGNGLYHGPWTGGEQTVLEGQQFRVAPGKIVISAD